MIGITNVKQALKVDVVISEQMAAAIQLWSRMYQNDAPWLNNEVKSLNLPAAIVSEIARMITIESTVEITGSARANYLAIQFKHVMSVLREQIEKGAAKGGLMFKPYVFGNDILIDYIQADMFYPVKFSASGKINACIFADQRQEGYKYYTRLEYHEMTPKGYIIRNMAFRSTSRETLGQQVPLGTIADWAELEPEALITGIDRPLFAYFRYPLANNIDTISPLGVSCYSRVTELIRQADELWSNLIWEFESGKRAIYVDVLAFGKDANGNPKLPNKRLYRSLDTGGKKDDFFQAWSPEFREAAIKSGLNTIFQRIEFNCGLAYGTLSDPSSIEKTATEIKISKQRTYATVVDGQKALQTALENLLYAMDIWATLANLAPQGKYSAVFQWDDSVVVDTEAQFQQDMRLVGAGLISKAEFRMRNMGEDEKTARAKIAEIQAEQPNELGLFQGV